MGRLLIDRRSFEIDDADLVNLQSAIVQSLIAYGSVALALHGRDGEEHVVVGGTRPLSVQTDSPVAPSAVAIERMLDEVAMLGSIAVVARA